VASDALENVERRFADKQEEERLAAEEAAAASNNNIKLTLARGLGSSAIPVKG